MPIKFVSGDLFDNAHHAKAFAQGCNCQGSMGAGIAKIFRARYPEMFQITGLGESVLVTSTREIS